jgi:cytochrome c biogenesis protein ResB
VICGCEWYHPITLVVLLMVAVILCEQELKSNPQKTQYHSTQNQRERTRQNLRKEKGSGEKDISACADAAARSSGLTSTRSFFRSHLICGDAPHIRAVAPLLESYR